MLSFSWEKKYPHCTYNLVGILKKIIILFKLRIFKQRRHGKIPLVIESQTFQPPMHSQPHLPMIQKTKVRLYTVFKHRSLVIIMKTKFKEQVQHLIITDPIAINYFVPMR